MFGNYLNIYTRNSEQNACHWNAVPISSVLWNNKMGLKSISQSFSRKISQTVTQSMPMMNGWEYSASQHSSERQHQQKTR